MVVLGFEFRLFDFVFLLIFFFGERDGTRGGREVEFYCF